MKRDQDDLIIERPCLEILQNSEVLRRIQIVNGLEEGNITRALKGETRRDDHPEVLTVCEWGSGKTTRRVARCTVDPPHSSEMSSVIPAAVNGPSAGGR